MKYATLQKVVLKLISFISLMRSAKSIFTEDNYCIIVGFLEVRENRLINIMTLIATSHKNKLNLLDNKQLKLKCIFICMYYIMFIHPTNHHLYHPSRQHLLLHAHLCNELLMPHLALTHCISLYCTTSCIMTVGAMSPWGIVHSVALVLRCHHGVSSTALP